MIYREHLGDLQRSSKTLTRRMIALRLFGTWLTQAQIADIKTLKTAQLYQFLSWLKVMKSPRTQRTLKPATIGNTLTAVRQVFALLYEEGRLIADPCTALESLRTPAKESLRVILSQEEMTTLLDSVAGRDRKSLKLRAVLELSYACGLRASEVGNLRWESVDLAERTVMVVGGKGGKDRVVPITQVAANWLGLLRKHNFEAPFLTGWKATSPVTLNRQFQRSAVDCGLDKPGLSFHSLRHSCATHLLKNGADVRYVQELLGHSSVETTMVYLHEGQDWLRREYNTHHPRQNMMWKEVDEEYLLRILALRTRLESAEKTRTWSRTHRARYDKSRKAPRRSAQVAPAVVDS